MPARVVMLRALSRIIYAHMSLSCLAALHNRCLTSRPWLLLFFEASEEGKRILPLDGPAQSRADVVAVVVAVANQGKRRRFRPRAQGPN